MKRLIAGALAVSVAGCGLTMTTGPDPRRPPDQRPVCTESMAAPTRDAYPAGIGFLTFLVGLLFYKAGDDDDQDLGAGLMAGGAVVTVASYASGGIGYFRVKRCRKAIEEFHRRSMPPPGYYAPPPPPS